MANGLSASQLYENFAFYMRERIETNPGVSVGRWAEKFRRRAALTYRNGNEAVIAARLTGKQPAFLIIRHDRLTAGITTDWICADLRRSSYDISTGQFKGLAYNIRAIQQDPAYRGRMMLTLEAGVALG